MAASCDLLVRKHMGFEASMTFFVVMTCSTYGADFVCAGRFRLLYTLPPIHSISLCIDLGFLALAACIILPRFLFISWLLVSLISLFSFLPLSLLLITFTRRCLHFHLFPITRSIWKICCAFALHTSTLHYLFVLIVPLCRAMSRVSSLIIALDLAKSNSTIQLTG